MFDGLEEDYIASSQNQESGIHTTYSGHINLLQFCHWLAPGIRGYIQNLRKSTVTFFKKNTLEIFIKIFIVALMIM